MGAGGYNAPVLALIQNLNVIEIVVIGVVAVLIFGRRLPEVAGQAAHGLAKARRALQDLRRQTGIDEELRQVRRTVEETEREARRAAAGWVDPVVKPLREANAVARGAPWPEDPAQPAAAVSEAARSDAAPSPADDESAEDSPVAPSERADTKEPERA